MEKINGWYPAEGIPFFNNPIVYISANGKIGTFKDIRGDWQRYVEKWNIKYWAYQSELTSGLTL